MLAVVCPGQGSQTPAMLTPWLELPNVADQLASFSAAADVDLLLHGTQSDADTIRDTAVAQPLIVASSLIALRSIFDGRDITTDVAVTAGHSVGEFAAAAVAGVFTDAQAVGLVAHRARFMAGAAAIEPTGMAAIIGGNPQEVLAAIDAAGLYPANMNSETQVVAAGSLEGIEKLKENAPARARVIALQVAGAFHTPYMKSAHEQFAPVASGWPSTDASLSFVSNSNGSQAVGGAHGFGTGPQITELLINQIISPVRWDLTQDTFASLGITGLLELAPGGVLTGLAKRSLKGVELVAVKSPSDLDAARDLVTRHA